MTTDKKKIAAAAHTAEQAKLAWTGADRARVSVEKARARLEEAEAAADEMDKQAEEAQRVADEARDAASGLATYAQAESANIGMER
jgi:hypothetical protein